LIKANYRVITDVLAQTGKVANPYPNVDAASGALLMHFGFDHHDYYTVLFGVSRAFGVMPALVWSRALGFPIERPNSTTLDHLMRDVRGEN
jgi:citrate synthase